MVKHSSLVYPSLLEVNIDIEEQMEEDVIPIHKLSKKGNHTDKDSSMTERVDLLLRESTDGVLTYNFLLQFTSSSILLDHVSVSQEYYYFRHSTVVWQCEYFFAVMALLYYLGVGNIREMFFLEKTNFVFLLSFVCVIISSISAILSRFGSGIVSVSFNEVEEKWLFQYLGMVVTKVQLYEFFVFFFSVLSANLILLAKVLGGRCPPQTELHPFKLWYLQYCNPMAENHGLPINAFHWILIITVILQLFFRGCGPKILLMCWIMTLIFMSICLYLVHTADYWIYIPFATVFIISYRIEHMNIMHFVHAKAYLIQTKIARDAMKTGEKLKLANFDLELILANKRICQGENELKAKCLMVRHISHELRNPLNTTSIGLEVLEHELSILGSVIGPSILELVSAIRKAGENALVIVNELLTYEKLVAGLHTLELAPAAILAFVREMVDEFNIPAEAKEIALEITQDSDEPLWANFDRVRMALVLRNFLSNAVKFTPNGGTIGVNISATKADDASADKSNSDSLDKSALAIHGRVMISVKDGGVGLSRENLKNLFKEGVQFNANTLQAGGGSGFGLYIAKGIMDLHPGGRIWATSDGEGQGCEFNIDLPLMMVEKNYPLFTISNDVNSISLVKRDSISLVNNSIISNRTENFESKVPLHILVVDDSEANRKMLLRMLKICGHKPTEAGDGLEAVKHIALMMRKRKLRKKLDRKESRVYTQFDVVLMDSCMPKMDGPQAAIQMREMGFTGPIIGITGNPVSDSSEFQSAGADVVMSKPIKKADLLVAIEASLGVRKNASVELTELQTVTYNVNAKERNEEDFNQII